MADMTQSCRRPVHTYPLLSLLRRPSLPFVGQSRRRAGFSRFRGLGLIKRGGVYRVVFPFIRVASFISGRFACLSRTYPEAPKGPVYEVMLVAEASLELHAAYAWSGRGPLCV